MPDLHGSRLRLIAAAMESLATGERPTIAELAEKLGISLKTANLYVAAIKASPDIYPSGWPLNGLPLSRRKKSPTPDDLLTRSLIVEVVAYLRSQGISPTIQGLARVFSLSKTKCWHHVAAIQAAPDAYPHWPTGYEFKSGREPGMAWEAAACVELERLRRVWSEGKTRRAVDREISRRELSEILRAFAAEVSS